MMRLSLVLATAALLLVAPVANAASESGDAGDLPVTAQDLSGEGVVHIDGAFSDPSDVDMYRLCLAGGQTFSASTVDGTTVDTQLFLFASTGLGVYGNDDTGAALQSTLPAGHPLTPQEPGVYYLAVGPFNRDPVSAGGVIFAPLGPVFAPTEAGASEPVSGWAGRLSGDGPYRVTVTGAGCAPSDSTAPAIELRSPRDGAVYRLDEQVVADYGCADEPGGSGVASCVGTVADGAALDTTSVGEQSFRVEAADSAGNTAAARSAYRVAYDFEGFLWPVRNRPHVNLWRAGALVPIRFELGGDQGLEVIEDGWPQVAQVECGSGAEPAHGEQARHPRWSRELVYRDRSARYIFRWRTERGWAGSCRQLMLKLADGTVKRADFEFVRRWHDLS
jgi:hypothetical protein